MSAEISINISKILNWSLTNHNVRLQVSFYTLRTHNYLAHKSAVGYYNSLSLVLNTSFKINYHASEHIIVCKITDLRDKNNVQVLGQIQIDLNLLAERKLMFIPFEDHDKVLEVRIYQPKKQASENERAGNQEEAEERREDFLQERFDFLDKITEHESQLKRNFSQKVYTLLKELKSRNHEGKNDRQNGKAQQVDGKNKNELDFRNRLGEARKKSQPKFNEGNVYNQPKNNRIASPKHKYDHQLLIHSVHAKPELQETDNFKVGKQVKQQFRGERLDQRIPTNLVTNFHPPFGGVLNPYATQYTNY